MEWEEMCTLKTAVKLSDNAFNSAVDFAKRVGDIINKDIALLAYWNIALTIGYIYLFIS
jgi:hypothetical protein